MRSLLASFVLVTALLPSCRLFSEGIACDPADAATCPEGTTCSANGVCVAGDDPVGDPDPVCGDGVKNGDEACDFHGDVTCNSDCTVGACGDGKVGGDEECDDGDAVPGDGCDANCRIEAPGSPTAFCGDGIVQGPAEACDPEDVSVGAVACNDDCTISRCGDGDSDGGEQCDDGNDVDDDGCGDDCVVNFCGNGTTDNGEDCDGGGNCNLDCTVAICGDGKVGPNEACDTVNASCVNCSLVVPAFCGNGRLDAGETCDPGLAACNLDCTEPGCGDGKISSDEVCDDGGVAPDDGCASDCVSLDAAPFCGDGSTDVGEDCDGGVTCNDNCTLKACGDGIVNGVEECDGGARCRAAGANGCTVIRCGDGIVDAGEDCDGTVGCAATCQFVPQCTTSLVEGFCQIEIAVAANVRSPRLVDINGDGLADLISASSEQQRVFVQNQTAPGVFGAVTTITTTLSPRLLETADVDGDGDNDIVEGGNNENALEVLFNNGAGVFTIGPVIAPNLDDLRSVDFFDADGDGDLDIRAMAFNSNGTVLLRNTNGGGTYAPDASTFALSGSSGPVSGTAADFDGDGDIDIASGNFLGNNISTYVCDATGDCVAGVTRAPLAGGVQTASIKAGDVDGDGDADLVAVSLNGGNARPLMLFRGDGSGAFAAPVGVGNIVGAVGISIDDLDGDRRNEIVASSASDVLIFTNAGATFLQQVLPCPALSDFSIGDANGDGRNDVACARPTAGVVRLFLSL